MSLPPTLLILGQADPEAVSEAVVETAAESVSRFDPLWHDAGIPLAVMGMLVVFMALLILIGAISVLPSVIRLIDNEPAKKKNKKKKKEASKDTESAPRGAAPAHAAIAVPPGASAADTSPAETPGSNAESTPDDMALPPELIAVLAAAAAEMEGGPVRIIRTRPLTISELAWTLEGRIRHHASHRIQPGRRQ